MPIRSGVHSYSAVNLLCTTSSIFSIFHLTNRTKNIHIIHHRSSLKLICSHVEALYIHTYPVRTHIIVGSGKSEMIERLRSEAEALSWNLIYRNNVNHAASNSSYLIIYYIYLWICVSKLESAPLVIEKDTSLGFSEKHGWITLLQEIALLVLSQWTPRIRLWPSLWRDSKSLVWKEIRRKIM